MASPQKTHGPIEKEHLVSLFTQGKIEVSKTSNLSYTHVVNNEHVLRAKALYDPAVFIKALSDYVTSSAAKRLMEPEDVSPADWQRRLQVSVLTLKRMRSVFGLPLTTTQTKSRLIGQAAEFVIADMIRSLLQRFQHVSRHTIDIPTWPEDEKSYAIGADYLIDPLDETNFILRKKLSPRHSVILGEMDMMVLMGNRNSLYLDVSTSQMSIEQKLESEETPEKLFMEFRAAMKTLLQTTGEKGYANVAKIHVLCSGPRNAMGTRVIKDERGTDGAYVMSIPGLDDAKTLSKKLYDDLQATKMMTLKNDVFSIKST